MSMKYRFPHPSPVRGSLSFPPNPRRCPSNHRGEVPAFGRRPVRRGPLISLLNKNMPLNSCHLERRFVSVGFWQERVFTVSVCRRRRKSARELSGRHQARRGPQPA
jgi:hypothetical protein